jgi:hypothetical protein
MKSIKIGSKEYDLMQTPFDIGDERAVIFRQFLNQTFELNDNSLWKTTWARCKAYFNSGQQADGIIELYNFDKAVELKELNYDAYSICFCLITLQKGEEQKDFGLNFQLKKLEEMRNEGLTRGMVEQEVENFLIASPKSYGPYLAVLELMKQNLQGETLKD